MYSQQEGLHIGARAERLSLRHLLGNIDTGRLTDQDNYILDYCISGGEKTIAKMLIHAALAQRPRSGFSR